MKKAIKKKYKALRGHECGKKDCEVDLTTKLVALEAERATKAAADMLRQIAPEKTLGKYRQGFDFVVANPPFCRPSRYEAYK